MGIPELGAMLSRTIEQSTQHANALSSHSHCLDLISSDPIPLHPSKKNRLVMLLFQDDIRAHHDLAKKRGTYGGESGGRIVEVD